MHPLMMEDRATNPDLRFFVELSSQLVIVYDIPRVAWISSKSSLLIFIFKFHWRPTANFPPRFFRIIRSLFEKSPLSMGSNFYEMLENPLGRLRSKLLPGLRETEMIELLRALADRLDELLYPPDRSTSYPYMVWKTDCFLHHFQCICHLPQQALITRASALSHYRLRE